MKLPQREHAIIAPEKLTAYLLNPAHRRGGTKARLLARFGYSEESWQQLEADIRRDHLEADVIAVRTGPYGVRYDIRALLQTPSGRQLNTRTVWQIDQGTEIPRLITLYPD